eukprot:CAMPEP_0114983272 /NCGR_PEP_ID=MMETSP0216-20121206/6601_1 /TAXON_ID=223996 /ORGANISM="Protocruzia adherens, Strain Boccale" /LENGTH=301 /DNA_ID=CAMNT_0002345223 /DNA_START=192 /DNA_END=1097 /DNA_ORIENTATION=+
MSYENREGSVESRIVDVWDYNFIENIDMIAEIIDDYPYVAMDTEFPGVVVRPTGEIKDFVYQTIRLNVDFLKIIQVGVTFSDERGNFPSPIHTWQFNFKFDLNSDMYAEDSIELLTKSGIDFKKHSEKGIDKKTFGEYLLTSGVVMNENVKWVSFHGGYDFGYLLNTLTGTILPETVEEFYAVMKIYFPCLFDIKHVVRNMDSLRGGLNKIAQELDVQRIGPQHQAGSDSLVTLATFLRIRDLYFGSLRDMDEGIIYGLGRGASSQSDAQFFAYMNQNRQTAPHTEGPYVYGNEYSEPTYN